MALLDVRFGWAAGQMVTGRITYIDAAKHQFLLDNAYMYTAARSVNFAALAIAERVSLTVVKKQGGEFATKVTRISSASQIPEEAISDPVRSTRFGEPGL